MPPRKSKISRQGQVTIPSAIRKAYGIKPGYEILFFPREDGRLEIAIQPPTQISKHSRWSDDIDEKTRAWVREIKADLKREEAKEGSEAG